MGLAYYDISSLIINYCVIYVWNNDIENTIEEIKIQYNPELFIIPPFIEENIINILKKDNYEIKIIKNNNCIFNKYSWL